MVLFRAVCFPVIETLRLCHLNEVSGPSVFNQFQWKRTEAMMIAHLSLTPNDWTNLTMATLTSCPNVDLLIASPSQPQHGTASHGFNDILAKVSMYHHHNSSNWRCREIMGTLNRTLNRTLMIHAKPARMQCIKSPNANAWNDLQHVSAFQFLTDPQREDAEMDPRTPPQTNTCLHSASQKSGVFLSHSKLSEISNSLRSLFQSPNRSFFRRCFLFEKRRPGIKQHTAWITAPYSIVVPRQTRTESL